MEVAVRVNAVYHGSFTGASLKVHSKGNYEYLLIFSWMSCLLISISEKWSYNYFEWIAPVHIRYHLLVLDGSGLIINWVRWIQKWDWWKKLRFRWLGLINISRRSAALDWGAWTHFRSLLFFFLQIVFDTSCRLSVRFEPFPCRRRIPLHITTLGGGGFSQLWFKDGRFLQQVSQFVYSAAPI